MTECVFLSDFSLSQPCRGCVLPDPRYLLIWTTQQCHAVQYRKKKEKSETCFISYFSWVKLCRGGWRCSRAHKNWSSSSTFIWCTAVKYGRAPECRMRRFASKNEIHHLSIWRKFWRACVVVDSSARGAVKRGGQGVCLLAEGRAKG